MEIADGQTFIIKKDAPYVFDRDTVIALAYPQENAQDIIIENEIYNDIRNVINIEAEKAPTAQAGANQRVTQGDTVTVSGFAYAVPPATVASVKWLLGSVVVSTSLTYTFTATDIRSYDLTFIVTDSDGRKASDFVSVDSKAWEAPKPVIFKAQEIEVYAPKKVWTTFFEVFFDKTVPNATNIISYVAYFGSNRNSDTGFQPPEAYLRMTLNGVEIYTKTILAPTTNYWSEWVDNLSGLVIRSADKYWRYFKNGNVLGHKKGLFRFLFKAFRTDSDTLSRTTNIKD